MVPISLLTIMIVIKPVSFLIALSSESGSTIPYLSTGNSVKLIPNLARLIKTFVIAGCSIDDVITCFLLL